MFVHKKMSIAVSNLKIQLLQNWDDLSLLRIIWWNLQICWDLWYTFYSDMERLVMGWLVIGTFSDGMFSDWGV